MCVSLSVLFRLKNIIMATRKPIFVYINCVVGYTRSPSRILLGHHATHMFIKSEKTENDSSFLLPESDMLAGIRLLVTVEIIFQYRYDKVFHLSSNTAIFSSSPGHFLVPNDNPIESPIIYVENRPTPT